VRAYFHGRNGFLPPQSEADLLYRHVECRDRRRLVVPKAGPSLPKIPLPRYQWKKQADDRCRFIRTLSFSAIDREYTVRVSAAVYANFNGARRRALLDVCAMRGNRRKRRHTEPWT